MYKFNIEKEWFLSKRYVFLIYLIKTFLNAGTEGRTQRAGTLGRKVWNAQKSDNCMHKNVQEKKNHKRNFSEKTQALVKSA